MTTLSDFAANLRPFTPLGIALVGVLVTLWIVHRVLERRARVAEGYRFRKQVILLALGVLGLLLCVLVLPVSGSLRGQLLTFIGIVLSAAVALSATTLLGNALAGVMLRVIRGFRMGDFIRVGDHFGRVSERGLLHTEIQTVDRELTTLPNLFLVTHPVTTVRSSGTIVSATVSLGYDVPRTKVEALLLDAARATGLDEPFVQIPELGDSSVTYRIAGLLVDVKLLISTRSRLRAAVMDTLHQGGVEIVSPAFMSHRVYPTDSRIIPARAAAIDRRPPAAPEETVFDKAENAEELERLQRRYEELGRRLEELDRAARDAGDDDERGLHQAELAQVTAERDELARALELRKAAPDAPGDDD